MFSRSHVHRFVPILLVTLSVSVSARAGQRAAVVIKSVSMTTAGTEAVVTVEANGALPAPTAGTVDNPPRIFLDFPGVGSAVPAVTRSTDSRIRRVRVGINSVSPLITRVVLDLVANEPHRIVQAPGRVMVVIGLPEGSATPATPLIPLPPSPSTTTKPPPPVSSAAPKPSPAPAPAKPVDAPPPVPPLPEPTRPTPTDSAATPADRSSRPTRSSYRPSSPPPSPRDQQRYLEQIRGILDRAHLQRPLLRTIETMGDLDSDRLLLAMRELRQVSEELAEVVPPETLRTQHDLILQSARFALLAATIRVEAGDQGDAEGKKNAASAAAGAILMFDRACEQVGCPKDDR
jgi:AMIN domain